MDKMSTREEILVAALTRLLAMHDLMMTKIDHGRSWYDATCLTEMNEAPIQARKALKKESDHD